MNYKRLLEIYIAHSFECQNMSFDALRFDVSTDGNLSEEEKKTLTSMMDEASYE